MTFRRLSILGFGLLGGSIAKAVRTCADDSQISVYDQNRSAISVTDKPLVDTICDDPATACRGADLIVMCIPPTAVASMFHAIRDAVPAGAVMTDVTSVKRSVIANAQSILKLPNRFVGSHPMAGGERSGSAASRADLFKSSTVVITPLESTDPDAVTSVERFWKLIGAKTVRMSPESHDRAVAEVSHLPHVLASMLMHLSDENSRSIAGPGFRDLTRVAAGDPSLWQEILADNADEVRRVLRQVERQAVVLDSLLDPSRSAELHEWLRTAAEQRRKG